MLDRLLSPAAVSGETITRGRIVNLLALVILLIVPLYVLVTVVSTPGQITAGGFGALAATFLLAAACYWLGRKGHVQLAGYLLLIGVFLAVSLYMLDPGNKISDLTVAPVLYILVIIPAGYVIHPLASFILATLAAVYTFALLFLAPPPAYAAYDDQASFLSNVVLVFALTYILAAVAWVFRQGIQEALRQAQDRNEELQGLARKLQDQRQIQAETGRQILDVAERLAQYSSRQARGSSRQAAAVAQVSSSIEELNQAAREIAQNAGVVDHAAHETLQGARGGQEILAMHSEAMTLIQAKASQGASEATDLEEQLKRISRVATIISHIASQIQLVAFNATLEAAEAGDTGRRFGVVAAEVKDLASDSLNQAKQVAQTIRQVQEAGEAVVGLSGEQVRAVEMGTELTSRSSAANQAIITLATQMAERTRQIQVATQQQQQAAEQVVAAMHEIRAVADRWVVSSYQMDEMVTRLQSLAAQLA